MIILAERHPEIGMVNPSSNNFNQSPQAGVSLDEYGRSLAGLRDDYIEVGHCISFCMLIKAEVINKIGLIDEEYILALYEDTDYSLKASAAGYRCVIARGSYVWHYGHGSTGRVKSMNAIAEKNKERFYGKWGRPLRILWCCALEAQAEAFKGELASCIELARGGNYVYMLIREKRMISRQMIFRDAGFIEHANVHIKLYPGRSFKWFCFFRLLIKRKKRYDMAVADAAVAPFLRRFAFLYRAKVVPKENLGEISNTAKVLKGGK